MPSTYPVPGYRTPRARSINARTGFQSLPPNLTPANDNIPPWVGRPANDNRKSSTRKPARLFNVAGRLVTAGVARHPAVRVARALWEVHEAITPEPMTAQQAEETVLNLNGWEQCYKCSDNLTLQYSTGPDTVRCKNMAGCGGYHPWTGSVGDAIPTNHNTLIYGWPYASTHLRAGAQFWFPYSELPHTGQGPYWQTIPAVAPMPVPVPVPMPLPWAVLPKQVNSPVREAGYGPPQSRPSPSPGRAPQHRPPGRGVSERKVTLMSAGPVRNLIEAAFEATEWVGIAHASLPKDCQAGRYSTVSEKFAAVYACAGQLNMCKLIEGVVNNYIEDQIIGQLGNASAAAGRSMGKASGGIGWTRPAFRKSEIYIPKLSFGC